ncbi:hypothetical protein FF011L_01560 [Roseimaritima multifibrata]|uniref:PIN domain-containing protein n=1 Tax=Roseimaritima multifibrata TaxID=1930274 RepID=A0A517M958_9BACT|nr:type II toxin-antitoxin system VapC family toxin [Roseimaritima multifibrata]QDS91426.1 hypothetical protein FF011L_01560 [Roseimaritima multifibrata]
MKRVVDASAVLAVCKQEEGAVEARRKMRGGLISAVNLSEVYYKAASFDKQAIANAIVQTAELQVISFDQQQASIAADLAARTKGAGVSFADRACLALGLSENLSILTGDHLWIELRLEIQLDFFREKPS